MQEIEQEVFDLDDVENFRPPEEKFPDVCCRECQNSSWNEQKNLFQCEWHGIFVVGADSCDEAEKLPLQLQKNFFA